MRRPSVHLQRGRFCFTFMLLDLSNLEKNTEAERQQTPRFTETYEQSTTPAWLCYCLPLGWRLSGSIRHGASLGLVAHSPVRDEAPRGSIICNLYPVRNILAFRCRTFLATYFTLTCTMCDDAHRRYLTRHVRSASSACCLVMTDDGGGD